MVKYIFFWIFINFFSTTIHTTLYGATKSHVSMKTYEKSRLRSHMNHDAPRCTAMHGTTFSERYIFPGHKIVILYANKSLRAANWVDKVFSASNWMWMFVSEENAVGNIFWNHKIRNEDIYIYCYIYISPI